MLNNNTIQTIEKNLKNNGDVIKIKRIRDEYIVYVEKLEKVENIDKKGIIKKKKQTPFKSVNG